MKDQIQFETNGLTVLAVKVPEDADNFEAYKGNRLYFHTEQIFLEWELPEGNWKLHAVTDSMTEEKAKVLVPSKPFYPDYFNGETTDTLYPNYNDDMCYSICIAEESLSSLLRSHGIDPTEKWVLLIKE